MKAVQIEKYGDNSVLQLVDISIPNAGPNQVVVRLKASSVNPVDYKIRSGFFSSQMSKPFPFTLGWEGAGIITEVGKECTKFTIGEEVIVAPNFMQGGTYAEYVAVNESEVLRKPAFISFNDASTLPFSVGTAYCALVQDAGIQSGQKILIHGAGGAVGQMAVQIAKNKGLTVFGTATGDNISELEAIGIDHVIDYSVTDFTTIQEKFDCILDLVGGETQAKSYALLRKGGILVSTTQPPIPSELEKYGIQGKMTFSSFREDTFKEVFRWIEEGKIKIKSPKVYALSEAINALSLVEQRKSKSKIVFEF